MPPNIAARADLRRRRCSCPANRLRARSASPPFDRVVRFIAPALPWFVLRSALLGSDPTQGRDQATLLIRIGEMPEGLEVTRHFHRYPGYSPRPWPSRRILEAAPGNTPGRPGAAATAHTAMTITTCAASSNP